MKKEKSQEDIIKELNSNLLEVLTPVRNATILFCCLVTTSSLLILYKMTALNTHTLVVGALSVLMALEYLSFCFYILVSKVQTGIAPKYFYQYKAILELKGIDTIPTLHRKFKAAATKTLCLGIDETFYWLKDTRNIPTHRELKKLRRLCLNL